MDDRIEKLSLKVVEASKQERQEFYEENPWKATPNEFLVRVVRYLFPNDFNTLQILNKYQSLSNQKSSENNFAEFKGYEKHLMEKVSRTCK